MKNLMIDIETLSTKPNALVVSIGAVFFDTQNNALGDRFYQAIKVKDEPNFDVDAGTAAWWLRQSKEARAVFSDKQAVCLEDALIEFKGWIEDYSTKSVCVWAKSPNFDCTILRHAFGAFGIDTPWAYYQERDVRTVESIAALAPKREGQQFIKHNALGDALSQAQLVAHVMFHINQLAVKQENQEIQHGFA